MNINDTVYCLDVKEKKIFEATMVGSQISESGYELVAVITNIGKKKFIESDHVHETQELAEAHSKRVIPIIDNLDILQEEFQEKVDEARIAVIGEPEHVHLSKKIMECK